MKKITKIFTLIAAAVLLVLVLPALSVGLIASTPVVILIGVAYLCILVVRAWRAIFIDRKAPKEVVKDLADEISEEIHRREEGK